MIHKTYKKFKKYNKKNKKTYKTYKNNHVHFDKLIHYQNKISPISNEFQKEIITFFFRLILMIKIYHWKTFQFSTHKATDQLYSRLNENMDRFIEVLLGKNHSRAKFENNIHISVIEAETPIELEQKIEDAKKYLINLDKHSELHSTEENKSNPSNLYIISNTDLFNIRDEILADLNQFLYLLTLHG